MGWNSEEWPIYLRNCTFVFAGVATSLLLVRWWWFGVTITIWGSDAIAALVHRKGWKSSANYGKQTRQWDKVFGTCRERVEYSEDNVDWDNHVGMPLIGGQTSMNSGRGGSLSIKIHGEWCVMGSLFDAQRI